MLHVFWFPHLERVVVVLHGAQLEHLALLLPQAGLGGLEVSLQPPRLALPRGQGLPRPLQLVQRVLGGGEEGPGQGCKYCKL